MLDVNDIVVRDYSDDYVVAFFVLYGKGTYSIDLNKTTFLTDAVENSVTIILPPIQFEFAVDEERGTSLGSDKKFSWFRKLTQNNHSTSQGIATSQEQRTDMAKELRLQMSGDLIMQERAKDNAKNQITSLIKNLNYTNKDLTITFQEN